MQVQAQDNGNVAVKLVVTLTELAHGPHKGFRSNHAKGAIVTGHFTPSADAKNYSTAAHFSQTVPVTVRFSNATGFRLQAQSPHDGDPLLDGSKTWPDDRRLIELGTIQLDALPADTAAWDNQMFNPLLLPKGITATADPLLQSGPVAYSVSFDRRLQ